MSKDTYILADGVVVFRGYDRDEVTKMVEGMVKRGDKRQLQVVTQWADFNGIHETSQQGALWLGRIIWDWLCKDDATHFGDLEKDLRALLERHSPEALEPRD